LHVLVKSKVKKKYRGQIFVSKAYFDCSISALTKAKQYSTFQGSLKIKLMPALNIAFLRHLMFNFNIEVEMLFIMML